MSLKLEDLPLDNSKLPTGVKYKAIKALLTNQSFSERSGNGGSHRVFVHNVYPDIFLVIKEGGEIGKKCLEEVRDKCLLANKRNAASSEKNEQHPEWLEKTIGEKFILEYEPRENHKIVLKSRSPEWDAALASKHEARPDNLCPLRHYDVRCRDDSIEVCSKEYPEYSFVFRYYEKMRPNDLSTNLKHSISR